MSESDRYREQELNSYLSKYDDEDREQLTESCDWEYGLDCLELLEKLNKDYDNDLFDHTDDRFKLIDLISDLQDMGDTDEFYCDSQCNEYNELLDKIDKERKRQNV